MHCAMPMRTTTVTWYNHPAATVMQAPLPHPKHLRQHIITAVTSTLYCTVHMCMGITHTPVSFEALSAPMCARVNIVLLRVLTHCKEHGGVAHSQVGCACVTEKTACVEAACAPHNTKYLGSGGSKRPCLTGDILCEGGRCTNTPEGLQQAVQGPDETDQMRSKTTWHMHTMPGHKCLDTNSLLLDEALAQPPIHTAQTPIIPGRPQYGQPMTTAPWYTGTTQLQPHAPQGPAIRCSTSAEKGGTPHASHTVYGMLRVVYTACHVQHNTCGLLHSHGMELHKKQGHARAPSPPRVEVHLSHAANTPSVECTGVSPMQRCLKHHRAGTRYICQTYVHAQSLRHGALKREQLEKKSTLALLLQHIGHQVAPEQGKVQMYELQD